MWRLPSILDVFFFEPSWILCCIGTISSEDASKSQGLLSPICGAPVSNIMELIFFDEVSSLAEARGSAYSYDELSLMPAGLGYFFTNDRGELVGE